MTLFRTCCGDPSIRHHARRLLIVSGATWSYRRRTRIAGGPRGSRIERAQPLYATSPQSSLFLGLFLVATVAGFVSFGDALNESATTRDGGDVVV